MKRPNTRQLVLMGILTAVLFMGQVFMGFLPNIEIVSLLVILYTLFFDRHVFLIIYVFVLLEGFLYGFGMWWFSYLYLWSILAVITLLFKKNRSVLLWSIISGFFGLSFGALCAIPYFFIGGWRAAFSYWVSGIIFDIPHCIGNFALCLLLCRPLYRLLDFAVNNRPIKANKQG